MALVANVTLSRPVPFEGNSERRGSAEARTALSAKQGALLASRVEGSTWAPSIPPSRLNQKGFDFLHGLKWLRARQCGFVKVLPLTRSLSF